MLAIYDEDKYLACPFHDERKTDGLKKRKPNNDAALALYELMKNQFDRIVYIWNKTTGIKISYGFAEKILRSWALNESWRNYKSTSQNLPYMLFYAQPAENLIGKSIDKSSSLYETLSRKKKFDFIDIENSDYVKVMPSSKDHLDVTFLLTRHKYTVVDEQLVETYTLQVRDKNRVIHSEKIKVDQKYLSNLMKLPPERAKRNETLLRIAENVLG